VFDSFVVLGRGMEPTFGKDDWVLLKTYGTDYNRGDIIVFENPQFDGNSFERIIGTPNERIEIKNGQVLIDGQVLNESQYLSNPTTIGDEDVLLNSDEYFVLGDNRDGSIDSRVYGPIKRNSIYGRYWFTIRKDYVEPSEEFPSDWQTYKNEEYGFEIKYPSNEFLLKENNITSKLFSGTGGHFWIFIEDNVKNLDAAGIKDDYYENDDYGYQYQDSFVKVAGINSYKQGRYDTGVIEKYYIPMNDKIYRIEFEFNFSLPNQQLSNAKKVLVNSILSTLKFTD